MIQLKLDVQGGRLELDKKMLRATLRSAGNEVKAVAQSLIRKGGATKTRQATRQSAAGQPPVGRTGLLARSIAVQMFRSGEGVTVRDTARSPRGTNVPYALFLEVGAYGGGVRKKGAPKREHRKLSAAVRAARAKLRGEKRVMLPRPFLTAALAMREASIAQRIAASINQGVKFTRLKASAR